MGQNFYKRDDRDVRFVLNEQLGIEKLLGFEPYKDFSKDDFEMILDQAIKIAASDIAPTFQDGDREGAHFDQGVVRVPKSFHHCWDVFKEGGWFALASKPDFGGQGLPLTVAEAAMEFIMSANFAFCCYSGMGAGNGGMIERYGTDKLRQMFVEKMYNGTWSGSMCLTEPAVGTDAHMVSVKAIPDGDHYRIQGTKIFITSGEHDLVENIIHLVIARIEGAPAGAKSKIRNKLFISFIVIAIAIPAWLGGLGFYAAGIDQIKYEAQSSILAYQQMAIANMKLKGGENPGLDDLKTFVYALRSEEIGFSFLADKNGQIIYNPSNKNILVDKWANINDKLTKALASGEKGSLYENVNESIICYAPITNEYRLGTLSRMQDRLPRFAYFFVWLTIFFFVCVFICICAGYALFTDISNSIVSTANALKDLSEGEGDLTARFRVMAEDETGDMARYFNSFMEKLNSTIGLSQKAARLVGDGTMQQASAVEETSASMKEFAGHASLNLQNAEKMDKVIEVVATDMMSANETMNDLMKEMEQLKIASDQTGKIIKTIDEISFQTNLLALNAAVEAARAGEAGAGFAVVADEVRNLALRAADSAKNTALLIAETIKRINNGSDMVLKAGQDFAMLSKRSQESRQLVAEITRSIKEQDISIQQVNEAMNEVDHMTQQNAIQADSLMANLAMFKTSEVETGMEDDRNAAR